MKKERLSAHAMLPSEIAALDPVWVDLWNDLPQLVPYRTICALFGFKNSKSASGAICSDPAGPRPVFVGRTAMFPRTPLIIWAATRAKTAGRRGCMARKGASDE